MRAGKLVPHSSRECQSIAAKEQSLETLPFALQPPKDQCFVAVERSHEVGDGWSEKLGREADGIIKADLNIALIWARVSKWCFIWER